MEYIKMADVKYWGILVVLILITYLFFSDGSFSLLFTLAGMIQAFGFALIVVKIRRSRSVSGLSRESFLCYLIIFVIRTIIYIFYKGYLPYDSTGDTIFKIQELLAVFMTSYILYAILYKFKTSYNQDMDIVKSYYLIIFAAIVAIFFHSNLNKSLVADYGWAFTQYLETVAILSQFIMFTKKGGEIETYTSHFVASQAISRIFSIVFWIFSYTELNSSNKSTSILPEYVGIWFMLTQIVHLLIMADFMFYWVKAMRRGQGLSLPTYV